MRKEKNGFTLVELLVVISIIAILLAVLMPALSKAKMNAKMIICAMHQKSILTAVTCYTAEYGGKLPPSTQGKCTPAKPAVATYWTLPIRLKYYYGTGTGLNGGSVIDILGMYMKDPVNWNCPMANDSIDWQKKYYSELKSQTVAMLDCSYMLFWNYLGYYKGSLAKAEFGFNPVMGKDMLMMSDLFLPIDSYNAVGNRSTYDYMSAHQFKGSTLQQILNSNNQKDESGNITAVKVFMGDTGGKIPQVKLNAAYLDNHVEKFDAKSGITLSGQRDVLPAKWK